MAVHRINVPYDVDDQTGLENFMRELDKAGQKINFVQYFCVAPVSTFLIQTTGGSALKTKREPSTAATPAAGKPKVERRTRSGPR